MNHHHLTMAFTLKGTTMGERAREEEKSQNKCGMDGGRRWESQKLGGGVAIAPVLATNAQFRPFLA